MKTLDGGVFGDARPPWIDFFEEFPVKALDELFTNAYYHGSLNVVEPEDLLLDWVAAIDSEFFSELLDSSTAEWIELRWNQNSSVKESVGLMWQRALRVTALLDAAPHRAISALRLRRSTAVSYLGPLVRNRACDPLGWYWATVSRIQADESMVWQWFRLCNLEPGTPAFHGPWGLLGLQRAPGTDQGGFRVRVATGLEQYLRALQIKVEEQRLGQKEAERLALGAAQELRRRYPFPSRWREYWSSRPDVDLPSLARRWVTITWGEQVFRLPRDKQRRDWHKKEDPAEWAGRARSLAARLRRSADRTARRDAETLLKTQRSYALDTGNSYYIVRTLCQFSSIVVNRDSRTAATWAEEAIDWEPWNPYCWTAMIATRKAAGDIGEAIRLSFEAIDRFPDDAVARNGLAAVLRQDGRLEEAQAAYQETIDRFPDNAYARNGLAEMLRQDGRLEEAQAAYQEAIDRFPDNAVARNGLAEMLRQDGRLEEAQAAYQETIDRFPDNAYARSGLAEMLRQDGRLEEAQAAYQETIDRFPGDAVARNGLAAVLRQDGRLEEAQAAYQETIDRFPDDAYARTGLAEMLRQAGRLEEAQAAYQETIDRFPGDAYARTGLAAVLRAIARADNTEVGPQDTGEQHQDDALKPEGLREITPADNTEVGPQDTGEQHQDDALERSTERYASPRLILRANM